MNKKELTQDLAKKFDLPVSKTNEIVTSIPLILEKAGKAGCLLQFDR